MIPYDKFSLKPVQTGFYGFLGGAKKWEKAVRSYSN